MTHVSTSRRTAGYKPRLAIFAVAGSAWVFVLVTLGAFTTSIGAGMAFADWPLSNGSINPEGWLENLSMFAEHSHRLTGSMMGLITIGLAVWLWRTEERGWLRKLGGWALAIVIFQGLLGGTRVLLDALHLPGVQMSVGQMLRVPHGVLAQIYVCLLIALAVSCTRSWIEEPVPVGARLRRAGVMCCALLLVQLILAALMRHTGAWNTILTFPQSTPQGDWLPQHWNVYVGVHFAHRVMALVLTFALPWFALLVWRDRGANATMRAAAGAMVALLVLQILLGMQIIRLLREPHVTTGHVVVGALVLATTFWLTWTAHRDRIETPDGARA